jgi:hypothetical protein
LTFIAAEQEHRVASRPVAVVTARGMTRFPADLLMWALVTCDAIGDEKNMPTMPRGK